MEIRIPTISNRRRNEFINFRMIGTLELYQLLELINNVEYILDVKIVEWPVSHTTSPSAFRNQHSAATQVIPT
jgi:hypothetical protein